MFARMLLMQNQLQNIPGSIGDGANVEAGACSPPNFSAGRAADGLSQFLHGVWKRYHTTGSQHADDDQRIVSEYFPSRVCAVDSDTSPSTRTASSFHPLPKKIHPSSHTG